MTASFDPPLGAKFAVGDPTKGVAASFGLPLDHPALTAPMKDSKGSRGLTDRPQDSEGVTITSGAVHLDEAVERTYIVMSTDTVRIKVLPLKGGKLTRLHAEVQVLDREKFQAFGRDLGVPEADLENDLAIFNAAAKQGHVVFHNYEYAPYPANSSKNP